MTSLGADSPTKPVWLDHARIGSAWPRGRRLRFLSAGKRAPGRRGEAARAPVPRCTPGTRASGNQQNAPTDVLHPRQGLALPVACAGLVIQGVCSRVDDGILQPLGQHPVAPGNPRGPCVTRACRHFNSSSGLAGGSSGRVLRFHHAHGGEVVRQLKGVCARVRLGQREQRGTLLAGAVGRKGEGDAQCLCTGDGQPAGCGGQRGRCGARPEAWGPPAGALSI